MYQVVDGGMVRMSARPAVPTAERPALADLQDAAQLRGWLSRTWGDPAFAAAVEVASPALAARVEALLGDPASSPRDIRRMVLSTMRYLLRWGGRATPFGLFAGVAPLRIGEQSQVRIGSTQRAVARVDHGWVSAVVVRLLECPALAAELSVALDGRAFVQDGRLLLPAHSRPADPGVSVRLSAPVAAVVRLAGQPVQLDQLRAALAREFRSATGGEIERMLSGLLEHGFLVSELHPPMTSTGPLAHVVDTARGVGADLDPATTRVLTELDAVRDLLTEHDTTSRTADAGALRRAASNRMTGVIEHDTPLSADLRVDAEVTVACAVADEAAAAASALVRLGSEPSGPRVWRDYHRRFLGRYGIGAVVPLHELLHAGSGLGYPAGYRGSHLTTPEPRQDAHGRRRAALLTRLVQAAAWEGRDEVELTEADLDALCDGVEVVPQPHTDLRVEVHAETRGGLDRGRFEVWVVGASRAAGTITGRFLDLLDAHDTDRITAALRGVPTASRGALRVQLSGPPAATEAGTIARAVPVLARQLAVGGHPAAGGLVPGDLAVSADAVGLYLLHAQTGELVEPVLFSALELVRCADPTLRFLCEITTSACACCAPFDWGPTLRELPMLPRVRYRRSVLAAARWTLHADDPPPAADADAWSVWRTHRGLPQRVLLGQHDRRLPLNLTEPAHRHLLRDSLARAGRLSLYEAPTPGAFGWIGDHAHELVLPLGTTVPARHPTRPRPSATVDSTGTSRTRHTPGAGRWISAHLRCRPEHQTAVLTEHLPRLLTDLEQSLGTVCASAADSVWFLRLPEPEHHLRLRIPLPDPRAFTDIAAPLAGWADRLGEAGLCGALRLDTYLPETGRFGAGPAMAAAEVVFAADSAAARTQLSLPATYDQAAVTAASMVDLVTAFIPTPEAGRRWLIRHVPRTPTTAPERAVRAQAIALAHPDPPHLAALPGGELVLAAWQRRRAALIDYRTVLLDAGIAPDVVLADLLHLHHARVAGPDLAHERACLQLARAAALSYQARTDNAA